ncbi:MULTISPECIES: DUF4245 domain-containing protein [unclassified Diaminobutyricimonas]|uniref:DUF4245 domain-containing protein n=1 Tax=unclassified Diaminobutyricimonas TaxID=2643261 RepID=UPI0012F47D88|nr:MULTISPECIES: DUF4245 domain-containing protein [unclassified Diaminobutyricimonas]
MNARKSSGPRIVAELGRPETPDETAARKAESSRVHRQSQTVRNLVVALLASLGLVLALVLVVVRPDNPLHATVDYQEVAAASQPAVEQDLLAPSLPGGWHANRAELTPGTTDGSYTWYVGLISPDDGFIAINQGIQRNEAWVADLLDQKRATGEVTIDGVTWQVYDRRGERDPGNFAYSMATSTDAGSVVLNGTGTDNEFELIAQAIAADIPGGNDQ